MAVGDEGDSAGAAPNPGGAVGTTIKNVPAVWTRLDELPVAAANTFHLTLTPLLSGQPGELVLSVGFMSPPLLTGTPEEQIVQAQKIDQVEIEPIARFTFSVERGTELQGILNRVLTALGK